METYCVAFFWGGGRCTEFLVRLEKQIAHFRKIIFMQKKGRLRVP